MGEHIRAEQAAVVGVEREGINWFGFFRVSITASAASFDFV